MRTGLIRPNRMDRRPPTVGIFARRGSKMLGWWVRGLGRPTPFFDDRTKAPCAVPRVVTPSERAAL
jgi:hypothetical protein